MRFNRTRIDCVCLREEKTLLQKANKELKSKLKNYLVTVNMVSGSVVHSTSSKFANRPSSMKVERIEHITITTKNELIKKSKQDKRPVTCIEGNLSNAVRHMRFAGMFSQTTESYAITNKL
jgi:glycerol-3-phosphate responsive antiterminator